MQKSPNNPQIIEIVGAFLLHYFRLNFRLFWGRSGGVGEMLLVKFSAYVLCTILSRVRFSAGAFNTLIDIIAVRGAVCSIILTYLIVVRGAVSSFSLTDFIAVRGAVCSLILTYLIVVRGAVCSMMRYKFLCIAIRRYFIHANESSHLNLFFTTQLILALKIVYAYQFDVGAFIYIEYLN